MAPTKVQPASTQALAQVSTIEQDGGVYRVESNGKTHTVSFAENGTYTFVGRIKGSYKGAREIARWHAKQRRGRLQT